jgi:hypothetical protein
MGTEGAQLVSAVSFFVGTMDGGIGSTNPQHSNGATHMGPTIGFHRIRLENKKDKSYLKCFEIS